MNGGPSKTMEPNQKPSSAANLIGKTAKLIDLINYQDGAVVSRTIISNKSGTVTLFAFDEEQSLSEHTAPFDALVYLIDGEAEIIISGQPFHLQNGDIIIMPAHQLHAVKAVKRFKMLLTMIKSKAEEM
jgi:quercetin dioxygenase-like cupin family protein